MVGLPLYTLSTFLLLIFCWRDIFIWGGWFIGLLGGAIGLLPTIIYALQMGKSPIADLLGKAESAPLGVPAEQLTFWYKTVQTFQVSLPTATASPFCPVIEYPFMGDNTPRTLSCGIIQSSWSIGYILLIIVSIAVTIIALNHLRKKREGLSEKERHQKQVIYVTRLCMLGAAILILLVYINSAGPINQPGYHARYIISLTVITPVILAPLYNAARRLRPELKWATVRLYGSRIVLVVLASIFIAGTCIAFHEVPDAQAASTRRQHLIDQLDQLHVTYLYTDYWTCYSLIVATMNTSHPIICAVVDDQLSNKHNRIKSFETIVDKSKRPPFLCATDLNLTTKDTYNCLPAVQALAEKTNHAIGPYFVSHVLDGYILYRAEPKS
jgi:cbb3-type cytochrome oxidase subunit 3